MHSAPSVTYPVGRSRLAAWLHALGGLAGLAAILLWTVQSGTFGWRQALALAVVAACAGLAAAAWLRTAGGSLQWDGRGWSWQEQAQSAPGEAQLALDLQSRLLLKWRPDHGRTRWLWLEQVSAPDHWEALRRAVYSPAREPVPPAGEPPAA